MVELLIKYGIPAAISAVIVFMYIWEDGLVDCPDGVRYMSGKLQPSPFHRRFCHWPRKVLEPLTLLSLVALGALMGSWKGAIILLTLPGAWLIATRPTTVDAPAMLLALVSSMILPSNPLLAVLLSCLAGTIHERGPVFAALYAANPVLLIGLLCMRWWKKPAPPDPKDPRVGKGLVETLVVHKGDHDWLGMEQNLYGLRGLPFLAAYYGISPHAWITLGVAWLSRLVGSDFGRFVFWAAPVMVKELPDIPMWMVLAHVVTFKRLA